MRSGIEVRPRLTASWVVAIGLLLVLSTSAASSGARTAFVDMVSIGRMPPVVGGVGLLFTMWGAAYLVMVAASRQLGARGQSAVAAAFLAVAASGVVGFAFSRTARSLEGPLGRLEMGGPQTIVLLFLAGAFSSVSILVLAKLLSRMPVMSLRTVNSTIAALSLAALYLLVLATLAPDGVTQAYSALAWPLLLALALVVWPVLYSLVEDRNERKDADQFGSKPWHWPSTAAFIVVPMIPVIRYVILNRTDLSVSEIAANVLVFGIATTLVVLGIPTLALRSLRTPLDGRFLVAAGSATAFFVTNMASLSNSRAWFERGSPLLLSGLLLTLLLAFLFFTRLPPRVVVTASVLFLSLEAGNALLVSDQVDDEDFVRTDHSVVLEEAAEGWSSTPDIFLLMYESYPNLETLDHYGIDNREQMAHLESLGFTIYHGTYSLQGGTLSTISRLLNASRSLERAERMYTSGDAAVPRALSAVGYRTVAVFPYDYLFGSMEPLYDAVFPEASPSAAPSFRFGSAILRGEFRFEESFVEVDYEDYLGEKRSVLASSFPEPTFLVTINLYPGHSQNSGACRPDEVEIFADGLERANREMQDDLEVAIGANSEAIIIVAGDHGPYLTKNCTGLRSVAADSIDRYDLQDRFGAFLAVRWPEERVPDVEVEVLQEVFPAVFSTLSDDEQLWDSLALERRTFAGVAGSVIVEDGVVVGGADDGRPLFNVTSP